MIPDHTSIPARWLYVIVFSTGACVLVLEILATRLLAPFFGTTIYSISSTIGITLGALSAGYALGGKLADRHPSPELFFSIIAASGVSVFFLKIGTALLPILGASLSVQSGPPVACMLLFFVPCALLGMLSPFAIRLGSAGSGAGIGSLAGRMFFWSTLGSIAGSFLSGFWLIPFFGLDTIFLGTGVVLALMGFGGMLVYAQGRLLFAFFPFALLTFWWALGQAVFPAVAGEVFAADGMYQHIRVLDTTNGDRPVRHLLQDRNDSSAVYSDTGELYFQYTKYYKLAVASGTLPTRALVLGAGAYSVPIALQADAPEATIDIVDIEGILPEIAATYFGYERSPQLREHTKDGRRFLQETDEGTYDFIFADTYQDYHAVPMHLATREFFELARSRLADGGIFVGNFIGSLVPTVPSFIHSEMRTFRHVFPSAHFFATRSPASPGHQNIIFMGCNAGECFDPCSEELKTNPDPTLHDLCGHLIAVTPGELASYPEYTDQYAPVEYAASRSVVDSGR